MVMSKMIYDLQQPSGPSMIETIPKQDRWHLKSGKWNTVGTRVRNAIVEFLDTQTYDVAYSDIKNYLYEKLPDDCVEYSKTEPKEIVWQMGNTEIKMLVGTLVADGKVIDL